MLESESDKVSFQVSFCIEEKLEKKLKKMEEILTPLYPSAYAQYYQHCNVIIDFINDNGLVNDVLTNRVPVNKILTDPRLKKVQGIRSICKLSKDIFEGYSRDQICIDQLMSLLQIEKKIEMSCEEEKRRSFNPTRFRFNGSVLAKKIDSDDDILIRGFDISGGGEELEIVFRISQYLFRRKARVIRLLNDRAAMCFTDGEDKSMELHGTLEKQDAMTKKRHEILKQSAKEELYREKTLDRYKYFKSICLSEINIRIIIEAK